MAAYPFFPRIAGAILIGAIGVLAGCDNAQPDQAISAHNSDEAQIAREQEELHRNLDAAKNLQERSQR